MEVTYRRNLHKSYMCVKGQEETIEECEIHMLKAEHVPYLLELEIAESDGEKNYLYDISGKQQLEDYLSGKKMDYEMIWKLLCSIRKLCSVLPDYLLRETGICLKEEYIYVNLADGSLYFTYLPFWEENLQEAFRRYMEQIIRIIDHQDHAATELAYQVYQMSGMKNISIQKILAASAVREEETESREDGRKNPEPEYETIAEQKAEEWKPEEKKEKSAFFLGMKERLEQRQWLGALLCHLENFSKEKPVKENFLKTSLSEGKIRKNYFRKDKISKEHFPEKRGNEDSSLRIKFFRKKVSGEACFPEKRGNEDPSLRIKFFRKKVSGEALSRDKFSEDKVSRESCGENLSYHLEGAAETESAPERETYYPTEILGARSQGPVGKLIYQGNHGCCDILIEGEEFLLGKNRQQAAGVIEAEGISRLHARISRQEGTYYLEDLNSTNGTYLNGEPIAYHQKMELCKNDRILFGAEEYLFS